MDKKTAKYLALICFAIITVWDVIDCFESFSFTLLITTIGSVLIVTSLLTTTPVLSAVGFAFWTVDTLISCIKYFGRILRGYISFSNLLLWIVYIAACGLLMIASITPKSAKKMGIIAAVFTVVRLVIVVISAIIEDYELTASVFVWGLLFTAGAILFGIAFDNLSIKKPQIRAAAPETATPVIQGVIQAGTADKLLRLKTFLDEGVITQEEFDQKKKELLNL